MITKSITKLLFAIVLMLSMTIGSGIIANQIGLPITPPLYACSGAGGGGGC